MSRREDLADTAIAVLAQQGARGLTHRAVDQAAGLTEGSTSYYFRSRQALLEAAVMRLEELDAADLPDREVVDLASAVDFASAVVWRWLTSGRQRQLARYELSLEATRRRELQTALTRSADRFRQVATEALRSVGAQQPRRRAAELVACLDGLVLHQIIGDGAPRMTRRQVQDAVALLIQAVVDSRQGGQNKDKEHRTSNDVEGTG